MSCLCKMGHKACGSKRGLQVFEEAGVLTGYCFSCDTFVKDPLGKGKTAADVPVKVRLKKTKEEIQKELEEISDYPTVNLRDRRLRAGDLDHFGIKIGMSEGDGKTPTFHYYPYTKNGEVVGYKVRHIETKRMWSVGNQRDVDLFGWKEAVGTGAKRLIVFEGELDCASAQVILSRYTPAQWTENTPAVVSLPHGAGSAAKDLTRLSKDINSRFKEVVLCFDDDEAGRKAVGEVCKVMPEVTSVVLPLKDANDCLVNGKGKATYKALTFNATKIKNTSLVFGESLHESAREQAKFGELSWPWSWLQDKTRGVRLGETIYIGGGVKMGKSEVLNTIAAHFIEEDGVKVFMAKPEEANKKTYKLLAGKVEGKMFHDPNVPFDYEAYDRAGEVLGGKLAMVNLYQHLGWETLKADIYEAHSWGAKVVMIDPITNLTNGMESGDANVQLQAISQELAAMALDLGLVVFIFCHLKSPSFGKDHEHGGQVLSSQFAGSRAMMRSCNLMLGIQGDKSPELDPHERNTRELVLLEDREFGQTGKFGLSWDPKTGLFIPI